MSEHPNAALLTRLFAAFADGDMGLIEQSLAEDVRSHTPGSSPLAGTASGRAEVLRQLGRSRELSGGTYRIEVRDVMASDRHATVLYRGTATRAGRDLDLLHLALYAVEDDRVTEVWFTPLDQYAFDAFWGA